jgi:hypothetical protein
LYVTNYPIFTGIAYFVLITITLATGIFAIASLGIQAAIKRKGTLPKEVVPEAINFLLKSSPLYAGIVFLLILAKTYVIYYSGHMELAVFYGGTLLLSSAYINLVFSPFLKKQILNYKL